MSARAAASWPRSHNRSGGCPCSAQSAAACSIWRRARSAVEAAVIASASGGQADRNASCATPTTTWPSVEVGGQQPARDEGVQLGGHRVGQLVAADPPPGGAALLVHGDQPQQLLDHLVAVPAARGRGVGEGGVGLAGQRPLHPTQLLVPAGQQPPAAPHPVGQLGQGVGQQRQRLPAVGVGDQPRHQLLVDLDAGQPRRALDHRAQRLPPQRPQRVHPRRAGRPGPGRRAAGRGTPGAGWPTTCTGPASAGAQQAGEPGPLRAARPG